MMPPDEAQAQVFRFSYRIALDGHSIWHQLSQKGEDLLRIFRRITVTYQVGFMKLISKMLYSFTFTLKMLDKPLVLIGVWLGGLIVKRVRYIPFKVSQPAYLSEGSECSL